MDVRTAGILLDEFLDFIDDSGINLGRRGRFSTRMLSAVQMLSVHAHRHWVRFRGLSCQDVHETGSDPPRLVQLAVPPTP